MMFLSLSCSTLDIFAAGKQVNHEGKCGLEITAIFHFFGPKKTINLTKK